MKKSLILGALFLCMSSIGFAQEFKVITIVESIVPGGIIGEMLNDSNDNHHHHHHDHHNENNNNDNFS